MHLFTNQADPELLLICEKGFPKKMDSAAAAGISGHSSRSIIFITLRTWVSLVDVFGVGEAGLR